MKTQTYRVPAAQRERTGEGGGMKRTLEEQLARQCAPVLLSDKAGALFTVTASMPDLAPYFRALFPRGIYLKVLRRDARKTLLLAYRPALLEAALGTPRAKTLLAQVGYPVEGTLVARLRHLHRRMEQSPTFPHEIGFFLGYPEEDVVGFIENQGQNFKVSGPWKVYGDEHQAQRLFQKYDQCRETLLTAIAGEGMLHHLSQLQPVTA